MSLNVVIVGAGAIGMSLAYELARRGLNVTIVDRDPVFAENDPMTRRSASTWAASGILPPANEETATDPIDRLRGLSHRLFPHWAKQLEEETGIDCQLERCGGWYLADTPGEIASMMGMVNFWSELSIDCFPRSLDELIEREPSLHDWANANENAHAWWVPDEYQIRTPLFLQALTAACRSRGVEMIDGATVVDLCDSSLRTQVTLRRNGQISSLQCDRVVVCAGSWTGLVAKRLKLSQSLIPVRGQILLLDAGSRELSSVINFGNRYLVPRQDGLVLVGSSEEEVGWQHGTTPAILASLRDFVREVCPGLASSRQVMAWSGLRPMTFDGLPICGKLPHSPAVFVATGHYRSGIHLAPATATCMADMIEGKETAFSMEPFSVGKQQTDQVQ